MNFVVILVSAAHVTYLFAERCDSNFLLNNESATQVPLVVEDEETKGLYPDDFACVCEIDKDGSLFGSYCTAPQTVSPGTYTKKTDVNENNFACFCKLKPQADGKVYGCCTDWPPR